MKKISLFIKLLLDVINNAEKEKEKEIILGGKASKWDLEQINDLIIPEITELLSHANNGEIYFKYGKKQRLLESSYLISDSVDELSHTKLGESILKLQSFYNAL